MLCKQVGGNIWATPCFKVHLSVLGYELKSVTTNYQTYMVLQVRNGFVSLIDAVVVNFHIIFLEQPISFLDVKVIFSFPSLLCCANINSSSNDKLFGSDLKLLISVEMAYISCLMMRLEPLMLWF